jgi:type II secretory pathway pseudopilin PulG
VPCLRIKEILHRDAFTIMNTPHWFRFAQRRVAVNRRRYRTHPRRSPNGFSLLEVLATVTVIITLAAIAAPGWVAFSNNLELATSQDKAFQLVRRAQSAAQQQRVRWQASFREVDGRIEMASHPVTVLPAQAPWEPLSDFIQIDDDRSTLYERDGLYRVQFDHNGRVNGQLGRLTLKRNDGSRIRRCVVVSTLLGVVRKDIERHPNGRECSPSR